MMIFQPRYMEINELINCIDWVAENYPETTIKMGTNETEFMNIGDFVSPDRGYPDGYSLSHNAYFDCDNDTWTVDFDILEEQELLFKLKWA
jgi:hypothetical protein